MNLEYSILWFDDSEEYFESLDMEPLTEKIESWGLRPVITRVSTGTEFVQHEPYDKFDLIAIDYNLGSEGSGKDFIAEVRAQRVYTEVIFYSADESDALWQSVLERRLEGVFIANRGSIIPKIELVAHQSLRKILDTENMRGIVMSEVGDIDLALEAILLAAIPELDDEKKHKLFKAFHKDIEKSANAKRDSIERFDQNPSVHHLIELSDSSKRWENFKRLVKANPGQFGEIGDYQDEVLKPRNFLAHGVAEQTPEGQLFSHCGKKYLFNDSVGAQLRVTIGKYREQFQEVREKFSGPTQV